MDPREPGRPKDAMGREEASTPGDVCARADDAPAGPDPRPDGREGYLSAYVVVLSALALALVASLVYRHGVDWGPGFVFGAFVAAVVLVLADAFPLRVSERHEINTADVGLLACVAVLGPVWAVAAALPMAAASARKDPLRGAYEAACTTVEVCLAGAVFRAASDPLLSGGAGEGEAAPVAYATLLAGAAMVAANHAANAGLLRVKHGMGAGELWEELVEPYLLTHALNVLTAGLGVAALVAYGPPAALVLLVGSVGGQALAFRAHAKTEENRTLKAENASLKGGLADAGKTLGSLAAGALGRKDGSSDRRAAATSVYARDLAREMGLGRGRAEEVALAGLLADLGMVFLPEELLLADRRRNSLAQKEIAEHPVRGEEVLASVPAYGGIARWVRWHHERPDGRGYPDKLRGPWIPVEAKILAVAHAYAGLVIDGPSRPGLSPVEARERLAGGMGSEFDALTVRAFLRILDTETEGYRMADDARFMLPSPHATGLPTGLSDEIGSRDHSGNFVR